MASKKRREVVFETCDYIESILELRLDYYYYELSNKKKYPETERYAMTGAYNAIRDFLHTMESIRCVSLSEELPKFTKKNKEKRRINK